MGQTVYIAERVTADGQFKIAVSKTLKTLYEFSRFHGQIADPSLSYKTIVRRFKTLDIVFFYDLVRFESEAEAIYSPRMDAIYISRIHMI